MAGLAVGNMQLEPKRPSGTQNGEWQLDNLSETRTPRGESAFGEIYASGDVLARGVGSGSGSTACVWFALGVSISIS